MITVAELKQAIEESGVPDDYVCYAYEGHEGVGIVFRPPSIHPAPISRQPIREVFIETGDFGDMQRPEVTDRTF